MKFIFSDSLDMVDPAFDFTEDTPSPTRRPYWDDMYAHEIFPQPPYDGMLISKATVGDNIIQGKFTQSQAMRFYRVGAREFLRLNTPLLNSMPVFGDCGAFSYAQREVPPYSAEDIVEFYDACKFTHGCSVDHIVFDFEENTLGMSGGSAVAKKRYEITLENAHRFLKEHRARNSTFTPIGAVQGWSPQSIAEASRQLCTMGYDYLAIGGLVPLKSVQIHKIIQAVRASIPSNTKLHLLGFAKADDIGEFANYNVTSFDTTSPMLKAFKDARKNYYRLDSSGIMTYQTALRVPHATENQRLKKAAKEGKINQEKLQALEKDSLSSLRGYGSGRIGLEEALQTVIAYNVYLESSLHDNTAAREKLAKKLEPLYRATLESRAWEHCDCPICKEIGIEVMIFRGSNRNRRRGMHNLHVYHNRIKQLR
ncbi:tRNA-guanine transglycosylase DpdA [Chlorobium phaeovibrioides]|uniref:tRNA-guanine transglycosylase DpdA n=1 Tax=Chlorobium phaeovibrioides TaxID=1094 RepID=UPI001230E900|nr:tRNA-guanine transglycosylase DpdA [Chlorobium phaeovibrioides]QEQ57697.1 hypothetical protein FNV82_09390 [Chlorobium phaeovibrioides]